MSESSSEIVATPPTPPPPPGPPAPPLHESQPSGPKPTRIRPFGIGFFVLGLLMLVLGIAKVLPGGVGTGVAFGFWGILLFAFSFISLPVPSPDEPPMSGLAKVLGIFYEPTRVFRNLRSHPYWLAPLIVIAISSAVYNAAFVQRLTPERIVDFTFEKLADSPLKPPPDRMEAAKEQNLQQEKQPIQRVQTAAKSFVITFVLASFVGGICFLGVMAFGGRINFWQAFAAVLYSYLPVILITKVVSLVLLYIKSPDDIHPALNRDTLVQDNLGVLFKPADHPVLFVIGASIGILSFYGLWLKAKGLATAGTKVSSSAAWGVSITLWVLGLLLGMIVASLFSSFMS
jgi:Yip1-like protein